MESISIHFNKVNKVNKDWKWIPVKIFKDYNLNQRRCNDILLKDNDIIHKDNLRHLL